MRKLRVSGFKKKKKFEPPTYSEYQSLYSKPGSPNSILHPPHYTVVDAPGPHLPRLLVPALSSLGIFVFSETQPKFVGRT